MLIRPALERDIDTIADVFIASFGGLTFLPRLHTDDETRAWIRTIMIPGHQTWIAEVGGRIIGFASVAGTLLGHLYVRPDAQGRGVGTALLEIVKRECPGGFELWVFQKNEGARRFYERHGCKLVELTDGAGNEEREPDARYAWRP